MIYLNHKFSAYSIMMSFIKNITFKLSIDIEENPVSIQHAKRYKSVKTRVGA